MVDGHLGPSLSIQCNVQLFVYLRTVELVFWWMGQARISFVCICWLWCTDAVVSVLECVSGIEHERIFVLGI